MADRLTAAQIAAYSGHRMRKKITREAYIDNAAISPTYIHERVKEWGKITFSIYNKHPDDRGTLRFPMMQLLVDNSLGYFDRGGALFPNGSADFETTIIVATIAVGGVTFLNFTGRVLEPEYDQTGALTLVCEHPLAAMAKRTWTRDDRIGGDTGIDWYFNG